MKSLIMLIINTSPGRLSWLLNNTSLIMEMLFHLPVLLHLLIAFSHPLIIPLFLFLFHSHAHFFSLAQTQYVLMNVRYNCLCMLMYL